jgi:hypothetical protein
MLATRSVFNCGRRPKPDVLPATCDLEPMALLGTSRGICEYANILEQIFSLVFSLPQ